jgi:hypothetical protein
MYNLGKAILGIEYLNRLRYERRPYEIDKGSVDAAYAAGLETIRRGQLEERINQGILEAAHSLASVPTGTRGTKPVIAITGDSYTRINQAANGGLFELLEELGCEVWPSPTMVDLIMTSSEMYLRQYWEEGRLFDVMSSWGWVLVHNLGASAVLKSFEGLLTNFTEPHADDILRYTDGLLPGEPELLVSLNVAKHVDFANKGVDGILNVYCLNCLVGTATTAIFRRLASRTFGIPMMPLVFDAMGGTHVRNRVEAFVHRVRRNREERTGPRAAGDADGIRASAAGSVARLKELFDQRLFDLRIPNVKIPEITVPHVKLPDLRLPERMRVWKRGNGRNGKEQGG